MEKTNLKESKITLSSIKERLIEEIKISGAKQKDIAKAIGVNETMISEYIHTKKMPNIENLARLCDVLDIDANYLLGLVRGYN